MCEFASSASAIPAFKGKQHLNTLKRNLQAQVKSYKKWQMPCLTQGPYFCLSAECCECTAAKYVRVCTCTTHCH